MSFSLPSGQGEPAPRRQGDGAQGRQVRPVFHESAAASRTLDDTRGQAAAHAQPQSPQSQDEQQQESRG